MELAAMPPAWCILSMPPSGQPASLREELPVGKLCIIVGPQGLWYPCPRTSLAIIQPEAAQKHGSAIRGKQEGGRVYVPFLHDQHVYFLK